jgi:hypothetical protein
MKNNKTQAIYSEPPAVRRKLAEELRKLATGRRFKPAERAEFARMSTAWAATLPEKNSVN